METTEITLRVAIAAAERLREPDERARLGALLSAAIASEATFEELAEAAHLLTASDPTRRAALREAFAGMQQAAAAAGITPDDVESELAAWRRERPAAGGEPARRVL